MSRQKPQENSMNHPDACNSFRAVLVSLLFLFTAADAHGQEIGKLFSTPEEREYLDYLRSDFLANSQEAGFNIDRTIIPDIPEVEEPVATGPAIVELELGGIMNRLDGSKTIWLNSVPVNENNLPANTALVMRNDSLTLRIQTQRGNYFLKPGQKVNVLTGVLSEAYENRRTVPASSAQTETGPDGPANQASGQFMAENTQSVQIDNTASVAELIQALQEMQQLQETDSDGAQ